MYRGGATAHNQGDTLHWLRRRLAGGTRYGKTNASVSPHADRTVGAGQEGPAAGSLTAQQPTDGKVRVMLKFITLKDEDGTEFAVNAAMITKIIPPTDDDLTEVYLVDEEDPLEVKESMEEVLAKVRAT